MAKFRYLAADRTGKQKEVEIEAQDAASSLRMLRKMGCVLIKEVERKEKTSLFARFSPKHKFDVKNFADRLNPLLEANIPLEQSLGIIEDGYKNPDDIEVVRHLRKGLHEGKRFSTLLREMDDVFPPLFSSLIEVGEESGCLPEVTKELRRFLKESKDFRNFVLTSSIYPAIVISVTLGVLVLLFTVFVPRFAKIFDELGRQMPLLTRTMLNIGNVFQAVWWLWPILIIGVIWGVKKYRNHHWFRMWKSKTALKLPIINGIVISIEVSRFIRTLSIMLKNHVKLLTAVTVSKKIFNNLIIAKDFDSIESELYKGDKLSHILKDSLYMPQGSVAMLRIAEESGDLGEMLERIAQESEEETRVKVKRLLAFLEPVIIMVLALIVLLVVLSIFMAIMEMNVMK